MTFSVQQLQEYLVIFPSQALASTSPVIFSAIIKEAERFFPQDIVFYSPDRMFIGGLFGSSFPLCFVRMVNTFYRNGEVTCFGRQLVSWEIWRVWSHSAYQIVIYILWVLSNNWVLYKILLQSYYFIIDTRQWIY